ncbi:MAG: outer membrane protein assembly factor BamB family protein [Coriobacteriia bacterium]
MAHRRPYTYRPRWTPVLTPGASRRSPRRAARRVLILVLGVLAVAAVLGIRAGAVRNREPAEAPTAATSTPADDSIVLAHPTYLGGPGRDATGIGAGPDSLGLIWKLEIGSGTTTLPDGRSVSWAGTGWTGQPTLTFDHGVPSLVIGGYDHGLRRINALDGTVLWRAVLDDVIKGTNTVYHDPRRPAGDRVVVVTGSRRGSDLEIGDPAIAPLRAFSFATGAELWRLPVPRTENYSQDVDASPLWLDGRLIAAIEPGHVLALDPENLTTGPGGYPMPSIVASSPALWSAGDVAARAQEGGSNLVLEGSPAVLGDRIYIASSSGHVYGLDRKTLAIEWDFPAIGDLDSTVVVTPDGMLLVGMERQYVDHGGVFLLDPDKPPAEAVVWFFQTEDRGIGEWNGGVVGSVALHPSAPLAAFCSVDGSVYVVRTDVTAGENSGPDGAARYPRPAVVFTGYVGGSISTPAMVEDRMVAVGFDGMVHLYSIGTVESGYVVTEIDTFTADGPFESTPLIWDGRVYVGCRDGYLYCLGGQ